MYVCREGPGSEVDEAVKHPEGGRGPDGGLWPATTVSRQRLTLFLHLLQHLVDTVGEFF